MRLEIFMLMTAGLLIAGYLVHSPPIVNIDSLTSTTAQNVAGCQGGMSIANPTAILTCPNTLLYAIMGAIGFICLGAIGLSAIGQGNLFANVGFASIYILPAIMIGGLVSLEIFVFPLGFLTMAGISPFITYPVMLVYNLLLITTIVQFIRG